MNLAMSLKMLIGNLQSKHDPQRIIYMNIKINTMNREDQIEELYNQLIQEHSELQYEYTDDELQDVIMEMVYEELDKLQS